LERYITSGTTGEPIEIRRSHRESLTLALVLWRAWRAVGMRPGDRRVFVGLGGARPTAAAGRLSRWLRHRALRRVDCTEPLDRIAARVRALRPDVLHGYPGVLAQLAAAGGRAVATPRLVITGGEELSASGRRAIADGFGATVRDVYASYECMVMAWECDRTGFYHVADDAVALEVLDGDRSVAAGEEGDVVVTALHSFAMPFVRYQIGDRAVRGPSPCPCGRPFSTLVAIRGRRVDHYTLPDGRLVHHYSIVVPAYDRSGMRERVARMQLIQEKVDSFVVRGAAQAAGDGAAVHLLAAEVRALLGTGVEVKVEVVDRDAFEPAGKFRIGVSKVTVSP
jgi:phenylacetate-CoA ligase